MQRHDRVYAQLHCNIRKEIGVKLDIEHMYDHVPKSVATSREDTVTILLVHQVQTDRTGHNNKPNIIIRDNEEGTYMLIGAAISGNRNVIKKEAENFLKWKRHYN